jgi:hypothetical protein
LAHSHKEAAVLGHNLEDINEALHRLRQIGDKENMQKLTMFANLGTGGDLASREQPVSRAQALRLAIALDLVSFAESLMRNGVEIVNYNKDIGYSPLILAVKQQNSDMVRLLTQHGADVNEYDSHGSTPLHTCVGSWEDRKKDPAIASILLHAGADPLKDHGENSPTRSPRQ